MDDTRGDAACAARSDIGRACASPRASSVRAAAAASAATTATARRDRTRVRGGEEIETANDARGDAERAARSYVERARTSPRPSPSAPSVAAAAAAAATARAPQPRANERASKASE